MKLYQLFAAGVSALALLPIGTALAANPDISAP